MIGFRHYHEGDVCPECGKRKLMAVVGRGLFSYLFSFGKPQPWLMCEGYPRCGFATRRIAKTPPVANDNRNPELRFR